MASNFNGMPESSEKPEDQHNTAAKRNNVAGLTHYRFTGLLAAIALAFIALATTALQDAIPLWACTAASMFAVAATLYTGFGWYFSRAPQLQTASRRAIRFGFIFLSLFTLFSCFSESPHDLALVGFEFAILATTIYFGFDWYLTRKIKGTQSGV